MRTLTLAALAAAALLGGCKVGEGTGEAKGSLYVKQCRENKQDYGTLTMLASYSLEPGFFAGEPIEDIKKMGRDNRLLIRLQSSGKRFEVNDTLTFDIVSAYEVARCVRGRILNGKPDYNERFCWWGPDGKGPPYVRIGLDQPARAHFAPRRTCPPPPDVGEHVPSQQSAFVVATAVDGEKDLMTATPPHGGPDVGPPSADPAKPDRWQSWIRFSVFGHAATPEVPPAERAFVGESFRVDFDQHVTATFHVELTDDRVLKAVRMDKPSSEPDILGVFDGYFDFELARGQGAQAFP